MTRYTEGIRKLFSPAAGEAKDQEEAASMTLDAGYRLLLFNGRVFHVARYSKGGKVYTTATGLVLADFTF